MKAWVVLTHEIIFFWKKTSEVTLPENQSKDVIRSHNATKDKHSDLLSIQSS